MYWEGRQAYKAAKAVRPACFVLCLLLAPLFFEVDRQWQEFVKLQQVGVRDQGDVHDEGKLHGFF